MISASNEQFNTLRDLTKFKNCLTPKTISPNRAIVKFVPPQTLFSPKSTVEKNAKINNFEKKLKNTEKQNGEHLIKK